MLTEQQCSLIETALNEAVEPRKTAAYLCLHMGLTLAEAAGLRREDVDAAAGIVTLRHTVGKPEGSGAAGSAALLPIGEPRSLPMPPHVRRFWERHESLYKSGECFVLSGETELPAFYLMQNVLTSINLKHKIADALSASDLRNAFIRRCIQAGMDLFSLCAYIGIRQPNVIVKRFGEYFTPHLDAVKTLEKYGRDFVPSPLVDPGTPKRMNLLILGAGSQGPVVKEIAEALGVFNKIAYLDDDAKNKLAIDSCEHFERYVDLYPIAIPSFGDCRLRAKWIERLERAGFILPTLIHPMATVSPSATVGEGTVVEMKVIVNTGARVAPGCIVSSGAVIDVNAAVGENSHIGSAATITKAAVVPAFSVVKSGAIFG